MAELLYRLGRLCSRRPWAVVTVWLSLLALAAVGFAVGRGPLAAGFDIPGTETARVTAELEEKLPDLSGGYGMVVFRATTGQPITATQQAAITRVVEEARQLPYVVTVIDPFATEQQRLDQQRQIDDGAALLDRYEQQVPDGPDGALMRQVLAEQRRQLELGAQLLEYARDVPLVSRDGSTALANITYRVSRLDLPDSAKNATREHFENNPIEGIETSVSIEIAQTLPAVFGQTEAIGVGVAAIALMLMFGTVFAAGLPVVTALIGLGIAVLATYGLSGVVPMASVTPIIGIMLGLAVGIDYALFIVNRHRRQLVSGLDVPESIARANGTAGNAVVFAGATVLVALLALNMTGIPFLGLMGNVAAAYVAVAVLVAITLVPALLALVGPRVVNRRLRQRAARRRPGRPVRRMSHPRAIVSVLVGATALLVLAIPALDMRLNLPDGLSEPVDSTQYRAYKVLAEQFGEGVNGPLLVAAATPTAASSQTERLEVQARIAGLIAKQDGIVAVAPAAVSEDGQYFAFHVVPVHGPSSAATESLVNDLRALSPLDDGTVLGVAGQATGNIDMSAKLKEALPRFILLVVGISMIIMMIAFRSLMLPVIATVGFVLSLLATYGALVATYQWGWLSPLFGVHDPGPLLNFLPIILVGVVFGLAMDYQLFLSTGMREAYVNGQPARAAVLTGFRAGRWVVTVAGIVMISVFAGFVFADSAVVRPIGFGLAFGVLADAFVVRLLIVPGLLHIAGKSAWWLPKWLDRIMPHVDIEGASLARRHPLPAGEAPDAAPQPVPASR